MNFDFLFAFINFTVMSLCSLAVIPKHKILKLNIINIIPTSLGIFIILGILTMLIIPNSYKFLNQLFIIIVTIRYFGIRRELLCIFKLHKNLILSIISIWFIWLIALQYNPITQLDAKNLSTYAKNINLQQYPKGLIYIINIIQDELGEEFILNNFGKFFALLVLMQMGFFLKNLNASVKTVTIIIILITILPNSSRWIFSLTSMQIGLITSIALIYKLIHNNEKIKNVWLNKTNILIIMTLALVSPAQLFNYIFILSIVYPISILFKVKYHFLFTQVIYSMICSFLTPLIYLFQYNLSQIRSQYEFNIFKFIPTLNLNNKLTNIEEHADNKTNSILGIIKSSKASFMVREINDINFILGIILTIIFIYLLIKNKNDSNNGKIIILTIIYLFTLTTRIGEIVNFSGRSGQIAYLLIFSQLIKYFNILFININNIFTKGIRN